MKNDIVIDACSLLNLYAAHPVFYALHELGERMVLLPQVSAEALYLLRGGDGPDAKEKVKVDLSELVRQGILVPDTFQSKQEQELFVELSGPLDDGEAACCAVAITRSIRLLTDDGAATKLMTARGFSNSLASTPATIKRVSESMRLDQSHIKRILFDIQERAHYTPSKRHPLHTWWSSFFE